MHTARNPRISHFTAEAASSDLILALSGLCYLQISPGIFYFFEKGGRPTGTGGRHEGEPSVPFSI